MSDRAAGLRAGQQIFYDNAVCTVVKSVKYKNGPAHYVYFKLHAVHQSGNFRSDGVTWSIPTPHQAPIVSPGRARAPKRKKSSLPTFVVKYILNLFKTPASQNAIGDKITFTTPTTADMMDDYSTTDYAVVPLLPEQASSTGNLYWGSRTLVHSKFVEDFNIQSFINIRSVAKAGGLCEDTAIRQHSNPMEAGEQVMDELRQVARQFYELPEFSDMEQLRKCGVDVVVVKLRKSLEVLKTQNNAGGCSQGRTRSGTVTLFLLLVAHIVHLIVSSGQAELSTESETALQLLSTDMGTQTLHKLRTRMDEAMSHRNLPAHSLDGHVAQGAMKVDRDDRFFEALQCFSVGKLL